MNDMTIQLPLLYVRGSGEAAAGGVNKVEFNFSRRAGGAPFRVLISDDVPDGAKEALRGSVWIAATTASLLRGDVMNGVRVCVEFSGDNDGGSAGALICLATLTALEGLTFPPDFSMTGTILPDGTVGLVGGIALKIQGASKAGIKRVCIPAFLRFERQPDGSLVDLFSFAEKLGVEVFPVKQVEEAFAIAHRRPKPVFGGANEDELLSLGSEADTILINHFQRCKEEYDKFYREIPDDADEKAKFLADPVNIINGDIAGKALRAFLCGKLFEATTLMAKAAMSAKATHALRVKYRDGHLRQFPSLAKPPGTMTSAYRLELALLDELQEKEFGDTFRVSAKQVLSFKSLSEIEGQIDFGLKFHSEQVVLLQRLYGMIPGREQIKNELSNESLGPVYADEVGVGHLMEMLRLPRAEWLEWKIALGTNLPRRRFTVDPRGLGHLLATLSLSLGKAIDRDVIACAQVDDDGQDDGKPRKLNRFLRHDQLFLVVQDKRSVVGLLREECDAIRDSVDAGALSRTIFALVDLIAGQLAVLLKYGEEAGIDLDGAGFHNAEFISYQIGNARNRALAGIRECRKKGVPCFGAIMAFYDGEMLRDMDGEDKMLAWKSYFESGLVARVLLMAFGKQGE